MPGSGFFNNDLNFEMQLKLYSQPQYDKISVPGVREPAFFKKKPVLEQTVSIANELENGVKL